MHYLILFPLCACGCSINAFEPNLLLERKIELFMLQHFDIYNLNLLN